MFFFFTLLCERSAKRDMGHILYYLTIQLDHAKRKTLVFLLAVEAHRTITRRNRVRSARGAGKHQKIQHSNRVSKFYSQNISRIYFSIKTVAFPYKPL